MKKSTQDTETEQILVETREVKIEYYDVHQEEDPLLDPTSLDLLYTYPKEDIDAGISHRLQGPTENSLPDEKKYEMRNWYIRMWTFSKYCSL